MFFLNHLIMIKDLILSTSLAGSDSIWSLSTSEKEGPWNTGRPPQALHGPSLPVQPGQRPSGGPLSSAPALPPGKAA